MSIKSIKARLDYLLANSNVIEFDDGFKGLFISDLHMGIGDKADDFRPNSALLLSVLKEHYASDFTLGILGDCYELWENDSLIKTQEIHIDIATMIDAFKAEGRLIQVPGNHDGILVLPESLILKHTGTGQKILLVHGHQGDFWNYNAYPFGKFVVRHIWRNLQMIGFRDPTTAQAGKNPEKHEGTRQAFQEWSQERKQTVFFGHTHYGEYIPPFCCNADSWVGKGGGAIKLVKGEFSFKHFD